MDVKATVCGNGKGRGRQDQSVCRDHHHLGSRVSNGRERLGILERLRLKDLEPALLGPPAHRARRHLEAASRRAVGPRQYERHLVTGVIERGEGAYGERRSTGEYDAQGGPPNQAALRWRFLSLARMRFCLRSER